MQNIAYYINEKIHNSLAVSSAVSLTEEEVNKLKNLYSYYHKLATCYKWKYKKLKKQKLVLNISSTAVVG